MNETEKYFIVTTYPFEGDNLDTYDTQSEADEAYNDALLRLKTGYISDLVLIRGRIIRKHTLIPDTDEIKDLLE